jgi:serine/threonine protein kinase
MTVIIRSNRPIGIGDNLSVPPLAPKLLEQFELLEKIGEGGMGTVYRVQERVTGKQFALKVLNPGGSDDIRALQRFEQEARSVRKLLHPNLVSIVDHGAPLEYAPYILMEYVSGDPLASIVNREGSLSEARAIDIARQVCDALEHAHSKGIVHRDLKPSNIIVADDGTVKVVDFGIAKIMSSRFSSDLTEADELTGSPFYMSPEQCACDELDARSDIYSLGCVLFEMVVGTPPFTNRNPVKVILSHINEPPRDLCKSNLHSKVTPEFNTILSRCLQKRASDRYQTVTALSKDLELVGSGRKPAVISNAKMSDAIRRFFLLAAIVVCCGVLIAYILEQRVDTVQRVPPASTRSAPSTPLNSDLGWNSELDRMLTQGQTAEISGDLSARLLHFPHQLGTISCDSTRTRIYALLDHQWKFVGSKGQECIADGDILVKDFTPLILTLNMGSVPCIRDINHFREGELYGLRFGQCFDMSMQQLETLKPRDDIAVLNFDSDVELEDDLIGWINSHVPNLRDLVLIGTKVDVEGVVSLKNLKQLRRLSAPSLTHTKRLLGQLKNSMAIQILGLRSCDITDDDLATVASMKNLHDLDLGECAGVTAKGLKHLSPLSELKTLRINGINDKPEHFISVLKGLHLELLQVATEVWSPEQIAALHAAVPNIRVNQIMPGYRTPLKEIGQ